jgi:putative SOS response-associated peptidase YedK
MCGRATVVNPDGITEKVYGFTRKFVPSDWKPRYNVSPHQEIPVVYYDPFLKQRALRLMHWNFVPSKLASREKVREFDSRYSTFNARIETAASAPSFANAWRSQRCLVVIDGMIEWVGGKRNRIPHLIRRMDGDSFALAGLWSRWAANETDELWSCTVLVRDADDWYSRFHDRMAALISPPAYEAWTDPSRTAGQLDLLSQDPYANNEEFESFPISRRVNSPRYDAPDCIDPASPDELLPLQGELPLK